jgi:thymidylate kinase
VKEYLEGKFSDVTPQQATLFYALDRFFVKDKLLNSIKQKDFVLSNRYTTSNIIHQATKYT